MQFLIEQAGAWRRIVQAVGPYLLIEIFLPGGTVLALALFVVRHLWRFGPLSRRAGEGQG
jgi:hypothetical protein